MVHDRSSTPELNTHEFLKTQDSSLTFAILLLVDVGSILMIFC